MSKVLYIIKALFLSIFKKNLVFIAFEDEIIINNEERFYMKWFEVKIALDEIHKMVHTSRSLLGEFKNGNSNT